MASETTAVTPAERTAWREWAEPSDPPHGTVDLCRHGRRWTGCAGCAVRTTDQIRLIVLRLLDALEGDLISRSGQDATS